ncbi:hypothetical protein [Methylobacterium aquaticum]|uniref:hypothetical protein n=1 Tax=Methylobacterium aquaticum TaxID=270351 RepID=UPI0019349568|nr:hypothetical protein [Methylobacterium aquaticum]QRE74392.1 hypothetical protein F1D61_12955 [Methylobacterium aquaticum]
MSDAPRDTRSFRPIEDDDLRRLATIGLQAFDTLMRPGNKSQIYSGKLLLLCLCQGGALHHRQCREGRPEEERRGIHDLDVWGFFERQPACRFPPRWRGEEDFGLSHFGRRPEDAHFTGRKVDVIGRCLEIEPGGDPVEAVVSWIRSASGSSPRHIRQRPVFVISAGPRFGEMIWPGLTMAADG